MVKILFYHLKWGKLTFIGKPLFVTFVTVELLWERLMDMFFASRFDSNRVDENVTAVIKTFERPKELKRLIESIKRFYPDIKIIVVDDSREPKFVDGVHTLVMPYDSGVSAGRNLAVSAVKTKYLLLLDDDYVFYRKSILEPAIKKMDENSQIDIMGGERVDLPLYRKVDNKRATLYHTRREATMPYGSSIGGMVVQDKVANFYIGRTEGIKLVGWDDRIKRLDHADFFTRAKGVLTTVFNPDFKVLHAQTPFNKTYMDKRKAYEEDKEYIVKKYYGIDN